MTRKHLQGNILFLILIAVALFAALSYAITSTSRTGGAAIEDEKAKLSEGELNFYLAEIEQGKNRLTLINSCTTIDYTLPEDQSPAGNKRCHLFHPDGGGVIYRDFNVCIIPLTDLTLGQDCGSGIVYAGMNNSTRMYTTPIDQGSFSWNNGSSNHTATGASSTTNGKSNTDILVALSGTGAPYNAANACRALGGKWFLPSLSELQTLFDNRAAIGNFNEGPWYWTSSEHTVGGALARRFSDFAGGQANMSNAQLVRCVRRD